MGGYIALVGTVSGQITDINIPALIFRNVQIKAVAVGNREMFEAMNRAISLHKLKPVVDRIFSFDKTLEAFQYMNSLERFGKICIRIS
ncbi:MAG: zinc-binding dehydrogenase [Nostoc sp. LPT]|nr:zinc-binding dehydrogenase [Nostoc sp. LPT]